MEGKSDGGRRKGQKQEHTVPAEPWGEEEGLFKDTKCHMFDWRVGRGHRSEKIIFKVKEIWLHFGPLISSQEKK